MARYNKKAALHYVWIAIYVQKAHIVGANRRLKTLGYEDLLFYIPQLPKLRRTLKGRDIEDKVPMLFNYAFLRLPQRKAQDVDFLSKLKRQMPVFYSYMKDPLANEDTNLTRVAYVKDSEIKRLRALEKRAKLITQSQIDEITVGKTVVLHGPPFDGLMAKIKEVNGNKIIVDILVGDVNTEDAFSPLFTNTEVNLENVIYTAYDYDFSDIPKKEESYEEHMELGNIDKVIKERIYGRHYREIED